MENTNLRISAHAGVTSEEKTQRPIVIDGASLSKVSELRAGVGRDATLLAAARLKHVLGLTRQLVAVTSLDCRDGASMLIARTISALAEIVKEDIVIVDANAALSQLSSMFASPSDPGLQNVLQGCAVMRQALQCLNNGNLWFLPLGSGSSSMASFLSTPDWVDAIRQLRERFRYIIVDAGTVSAAECMLIASASDGVILALATGRTKQETNRVREDFKRLGIPLLGAMLTERRSGRH